MRWWLDHMEAWNGRAIFGSAPDIIIESDASKSGWGARCGTSITGGKWSSDERSLHINCLELLAGSFAIKCWTKDKVSCHVLLKMDNVSAVRYINHLGGTKSRVLADMARELWHFCLDNEISVTAEYLPGASNVIADWCSREWSDISLWQLEPLVFQRLHHLWGPFTVDLFASKLDHQLPNFSAGSRIPWRQPRMPSSKIGCWRQSTPFPRSQ